MSLVAYASSDDEGSSDVEETPEVTTETERLNKSNEESVDKHVKGIKSHPESSNFESGDSFPIEDDEYDILPNQTVGLTLPPPKNAAETANQSFSSKEAHQTTSVLSALPAPQAKTSQIIGFKEEDELEDEVKPKAKHLADAPLPPSKQKKKQAVKITVPSLDDYDSDEDEPKKKKLKPSQGKSGLFSLLPAPKHVSSKEVGRVLLPHSLSKKTSAAPGAKKKALTQTVSKPAVHGGFNGAVLNSKDDSDDEEESVNFFSLGQEEKNIAPTVDPLPDVRNMPKATVRNVSSGVMHEPSLRGPWLGPAAPASDLLGPSLQPAGPSMPSYGDRAATSVMDNNPIKSTNVNNVDSSDQIPSGIYPEGPLHTTQYSGDYGQNYYPEVGEVQSLMQDEEFLKMQGKKARGKEEINIIDVHGDDQRSKVDLMKHMSEEKDMRSFSKKGKDMPSSQQRRKHQITYLAFQAKERELELKNQWAQNRQTRQQTQSKYGF